MPIIILVHGFTNNPTDFDLWRKHLQQQFTVVTIPYDRRETVYEPIEKYAEVLANFITNESFNNEMILIGYSMGGLVIRYYLQNLYDRKQSLKQVITIATPQYGTDFATIGIIGGVIGDLISKFLIGKTLFEKPVINTSIAQLSPVSPFINRLNRYTPKTQKIYSRIPLLNIWLKNDFVITPAGNAIAPFKEIINREVTSTISHNLVLKQRGLEEILNNEIIQVLKRQKQSRRKGPQTLEIESTISNVTNLSASIRKLQRTWPSGGSSQTNATNCAS